LTSWFCAASLIERTSLGLHQPRLARDTSLAAATGRTQADHQLRLAPYHPIGQANAALENNRNVA
jgi:hypothetical protein